MKNGTHGSTESGCRVMIAVAALCASALLLQAGEARACTSPPPTPDIWVRVLVQGPPVTVVEITVHGLTTFSAGITQFCGCGLNLNQVPSISAVQGALVTDAGGLPVNGFAFGASVNASLAIAGQSGGVWAGFLSPIVAPVAPGQTVELSFVAELVPGATLADLMGELQAASPVMAAYEADSTGAVAPSPPGHGYHAEAAGVVLLMGFEPVPSMSPGPLFLLFSLLGAGGVYVLERNRRRRDLRI